MDFKFNRKERLKITKKFKDKGRTSRSTLNWRIKRNDKRREKEIKLTEELEERKQIEQPQDLLTGSSRAEQPNKFGNQKTWYSINVALPGSILNNIQTKELKAYITGELARMFTIFCVDEIVVFDETAKLTEAQIDAYYSGDWSGEEPINETNLECNFYMTRIFEYMECPQYLRKAIFPIHRSLNFAGLLNPLDAMHHLRSTDLHLPYREGVILDEKAPAKNGRQRCDVGLNKIMQVESDEWIPPNTRVTVKIDQKSWGHKNLRGALTNPNAIRDEAGIYWGYSVRIAKSLSDAVPAGSYDIVIGTSERGSPIENLQFPRRENCKILVVFGGLGGLESAIDADQTIRQSDPAEFFPNYINCLPDQGSRVIRTEEAIPICLTALKCRLNSLDLSN